jgi:hypothetical protein
MLDRAGFTDAEAMRLQRGNISCHAVSERWPEGFDELGGNAELWRRQAIRTFLSRHGWRLDRILNDIVHDWPHLWSYRNVRKASSPCSIVMLDITPVM